MDQMIEVMVEQAKVEDDIFEEHGCSNEDVEKALMAYAAAKDPEVVKAMTQF